MESNIISWYDFKQNSKILFLGDKDSGVYKYLKKEYTKVDNEVKEKDYDYIIIASDRIKPERLEIAIENLKKSGTLLIMFNNDYGISKFVTYDKKNNKSFLDEIEENPYNKEYIYEKLNKEKFQYINLYIPFPNYKRADVIITEKLDDISNKLDKYFYDYNENSLVITNEINTLRKIAKNNKELFFNICNSYLIEASKTELNTNVMYVSFNNYRKEKYQLSTIMRKDIVEKRATCKEAEEHIMNIKSNLRRLKDYEFNIIDDYTNDTLYSIHIKNKKTLDIELGEQYQNEELIVNRLNDFRNKLLKRSIKHSKSNKKYYNEILKEQTEDVLNDFNYLKYAFYDMVPKNCFLIEGEYYFFDQEWMAQYLPVEFIIYRSVINSYDLVRKINVDDLFEKLEIKQYKELFEKIDNDLRNRIIDIDKLNILNKKYDTLNHIVYKNNVLEQQIEDYKENDLKQNEYIKSLEENNLKQDAYIKVLEKNQNIEK